MKINTIAIIGCGNMGGAIATGLVKANLYAASSIHLSDMNNVLLSEYAQKNYKTFQNNKQAIKDAQLIIVALKPYLVEKVLQDIKSDITPNQAILSVAATISSAKIQEVLQTSNEVIVCMPNTGISLLESMTCIATPNASTDTMNEIKSLFDKMGRCFIIDEKNMAAATVIAGCGPAFALRFIKAMMNGGVEMGFRPDEVRLMAAQITKAAAELILQNNNHPEQEIDKITTPGGITIRGLNEMESNGFSPSIIEGMLSAFGKMK